MSVTLETARQYQDILTSQDPQQQYAFDSIFDSSSFQARRRSKWKFKMLQRINPKLRRALRPGEKVRYLTRGTRFAFWESYFLGWVANLINRRAIVITDQRIVLIQIDSKLRARDLIEQIRYAAVADVSSTLLGNARLVLNNGKKVVFAYVPRADRKFLKKLVDLAHQHVLSDRVGVEDLCPHCYSTVVDRPLLCPACGGAFKSVKEAALRSLIFPGLGDWYLGHRVLAGFEMFFVAFLWLGMLIPTEEFPFSVSGMIGGMLVLFIFVHIPDAVLTRYVARRGLYPASPGSAA